MTTFAFACFSDVLDLFWSSWDPQRDYESLWELLEGSGILWELLRVFGRKGYFACKTKTSLDLCTRIVLHLLHGWLAGIHFQGR